MAILVRWGIAFFEYAIQVPANRSGYAVLTVGQLKILQEVVTLCVFVPFSIYYMNERIGWNYALAGLFLIGAVYSVFSSRPEFGSRLSCKSPIDLLYV